MMNLNAFKCTYLRKVIYFLFALAVIYQCPYNNNEALSEPPPKFTITGRVKPLPNVEKMFLEIKDKASEKGVLYVILSKGSIEETSDILSGEFEFELEWVHSRDEITLRAVYPKGLVAYRDIVIYPNKIFHEGTRRYVIDKVILLTRIEDRFEAEKKRVKSFLQSGDCYGSLGIIQDIKENFLPEGPEFFFIVSKLRADVLYKGVDYNCSYHESDIEAIFEVEKHNSFESLSGSRKFNIYAQYARALQRINTPDRYLASGRKFSDIQNYCFRRAIELQNEAELRSDKGWKLSSEMINGMYRNKYFEEAMDEILKFFEKSNFPTSDLSISQKKCAIKLLTTYGKSLSRWSQRSIYLEENYINEMAKSMIFSDYWDKFGYLLSKWSYLYPKNSVTPEGKGLYVCSILSDKIHKERSNNGHE